MNLKEEKIHCAYLFEVDFGKECDLIRQIKTSNYPKRGYKNKVTDENPW